MYAPISPTYSLVESTLVDDVLGSLDALFNEGFNPGNCFAEKLLDVWPLFRVEFREDEIDGFLFSVGIDSEPEPWIIFCSDESLDGFVPIMSGGAAFGLELEPTEGKVKFVSDYQEPIGL